MDWTVYILRCNDGRHYVGITNDLETRMAAHRNGPASGGSRSVAGRGGPDRVVWSVGCRDRSVASQVEYRLKKRIRPEVKRDLIAGRVDWTEVPALAGFDLADTGEAAMSASPAP